MLITESAGLQSSVVAKWSYEIDQYGRRMESWDKRCDDIVKRYADKRGGVNETNTKRFNAFWSNIQTQLPALYAQVPKPEIDRRFKDSDQVGRACAELLQRCASFSLSSNDVHPIIKQAMLDYLLCARGVMWVRYCPTFKDLDVPGGADEEAGEQVTDDVEEGEEQDEPAQDIEFEEALVDYVHRKDFGHMQARTWEEVPAVWRATYLDRKALVERFGAEKGNACPLNHVPDEKTKDDAEREKKAKVYEIWDKAGRKAIWICKDYPDPLDERDDPLRLRKFFPCAKPLFGTLTNDNLEPTPDFVLYQDQLNMLDELTARITMVTKSLKVAGVFDASQQGLQRLLNEGVENTLIAVDSWAAFAEKGGLEGSFELMPFKDITEALLAMYQARESIKQDMYEITGLSDLRRGVTDSEETATAQELKGQFSEMRFADRRQDVAHFLRDTIQIMVEIIAEHFHPETLKAMSGLQMFDTVAEKQQALAMYPTKGMAQLPGAAPQAPQQGPQMPQPMPGQPQPGLMGMAGQPGPVPVPDEAMQEKLNAPTWEEVMALLRNDALRSFRIDIETDSTIRADEQAEREAVTEYAGTVSQLLKEAGPMVQGAPQLGPLIGEILLFVSRRYKIGRQLEGELESAVDAMKKAAANPQPPQPPIEIQKIHAQGAVDEKLIQLKGQVDGQAKLGAAQLGAQTAQHKAQLDAQVSAAEQQAQGQQAREQNAIEAQRALMEAHMEQQTEAFRAHLEAAAKTQQQQFDLLIARLNNAAKVEVAEIAAQTTLDAAQISAANTAEGE